MELTQAQLQSLQTLTLSPGKVMPDKPPIGGKIVAEVAAIDPESGEVTLKINDKLITAKTLLQLTALLKTGQSLELTIAQTSASKIILQLPEALTDKLIQQNALREALPKQQPVTDAIIQIKMLIKNRRSSPLPDKIMQFAKNFVAKLPTPAQLSTPSGVKQAILQSGLFLETKLTSIVQGKNTESNKSIRNDVKAMLLGLKTVLTKEVNSQKSEIKPQVQLDKNFNPIPKISISSEQKAETTVKTLDSPKTEDQTQQVKNSNQALTEKKLAENKDTLKPSEIIDKTKQIKTDILLEKKSGDKITDKKIHQVLNSLLNSKKKLGSNTVRTASPPISIVNTITQQSTNTFKSAQQYTVREALVSNNDIAMSIIKSQNVSEAPTPRINSIIDLIETLIKQVDSAISRTQVHQLNAVVDQETGKLAMSLEIPVNDDDNLHLVQMHIEKEPNAENETETVVTVNLAIDLNAIGPIYARITLINDSTSVVLWAERESTFNLVKQNVNELHNNLEGSGLKPDNIAYHHGQPPQSKFTSNSTNQNLLDVRA